MDLYEPYAAIHTCEICAWPYFTMSERSVTCSVRCRDTLKRRSAAQIRGDRPAFLWADRYASD